MTKTTKKGMHMAATNIELGIVGGLKQTIVDLDRALADDAGVLSSRVQALALRNIAHGVLLTLDNHTNCPALRFYLAFRGWLAPMMFGLLLAAFMGGLYAFQRFGLAMPSP